MLGFNDEEAEECCRLLQWGLAEDLGEQGDVTSLAVLPADLHGAAVVVARKDGVVAGLPALVLLASLRDFGVKVELLQHDGPAAKGQPVARLSGFLRGVLGVERLALNLLGRLSGVATLTAHYVAAVAGSRAVIYDTRKTTPGWRRLEKYAVRVGGGANHRLGLFDGVLIKDNHLAGIAHGRTGAVQTALARARAALGSSVVIEVEVDTLDQLDEALAASPDVVLLDNMSPEVLREAVLRRNSVAPGVRLEASGGVDLWSVAAIAAAGVDRISIGALTHSAPALDLGLDYEK